MSCGENAVTEIILPPPYHGDTVAISGGSPYYVDYGAPPVASHHHHHHGGYHEGAPARVPRLVGGVQPLPGMYVEPTFEEPVGLPVDDWDVVDASVDASASDKALVAAAQAISVPTSLSGYDTFVRAQWYCQVDTELVRATIAADASATAYYFFGRSLSGGGYVIVGTRAYDESSLPFPPAMPRIVGGFYDNITTAGKRGWGHTLVPSSRTTSPPAGVFRGPNMCFVLAGGEAARVAARTIRVIGTPKTAELSVEVVGLVPSDDETPLVTGTVGKDLHLGTARLPCVVRIKNVPAEAEYAFQGIEVTLTATH